MKNFKEEIEAIKAQIAALENNLTERSEEYEHCCGEPQCGCGCEEAPVEVEDQVILTRGEVIKPEEADTVVFTKEELITFATKLMERTVTACKEAVNGTEFKDDIGYELSLSYNNQIELEIDDSTIQGVVCDEIDDIIELDNDSVEVEVNDILDEMLYEKPS